MKYVLGVDPGKKGAFVLINKSGGIVECWDMDYNGPTLSATGTAQVYKEVLTITGKDDLHVVIEKAFTMPTDSLGMDQWRSIQKLHTAAKILTQSYDKHVGGSRISKESFAALFGDLSAQIELTDFLETAKYRPDGRQGNFNYAKAAGVLEICAAFGIAYTLVSPKTWCSAMHTGVDSKLKPKDKSKQIIERRWPWYSEKGSKLWRPRARSMDEGRQDAFMIAQWFLENGG